MNKEKTGLLNRFLADGPCNWLPGCEAQEALTIPFNTYTFFGG
jgi:hypothetical protein